MKSNIHNLGSSATYKTRHIINVTEKEIGNIPFVEIKGILNDLPDLYSDLEKAVQDRNAKAVGNIILMAIYNDKQSRITKALYS